MQNIIEKMDFEIYRNLRQALELGKWQDGKKLTREQKQNTMQLILLFEHKKDIPLNERVGFIEDACETLSTKEQEKSEILISINK